MGQGDNSVLGVSEVTYFGVRLPSFKDLSLGKAAENGAPDEASKSTPPLRTTSLKSLIAAKSEDAPLIRTPSRAKSLKEVLGTVMPQISKVTTMTSIPATEVPTDLPFRHVLDTPLTPWLTIPYSYLKNKSHDYKAKPQFLDTVSRVANHLGEPQGIVVLGGSCVGVTGWDSIPLAQQASALTQGTGAFEASAMTYYRLKGRDAVNILNYLTPRDVNRVKVGTSFFVIFTTPLGTVDDEAVAMRIAEDEFLFSCGGCKQLTFAFEALRKFPDAELTVLDMVSFNLKGPERLKSMMSLICAEDKGKVADLAECTFTRVRPRWEAKENVWVMRSKIGYEMWGAPKVITGAWDIICTDKANFTPCAWDILNMYRMECNDMLFTLYPLDLHGGTTLHEVQCGYMINKKSMDWIGKAKLEKSKNKKTLELRKLISRTSDAQPAQIGAPIYSEDGDLVGAITSGAFSLALGRAVAFAHIRPDAQCVRVRVGAADDAWELIPTK